MQLLQYVGGAGAPQVQSAGQPRCRPAPPRACTIRGLQAELWVRGCGLEVVAVVSGPPDTHPRALNCCRAGGALARRRRCSWGEGAECASVDTLGTQVSASRLAQSVLGDCGN